MPTDYLMRFLEWTRWLAAIVAKRESGQLPEALEDIEKACLRATGLTFSVVRHNSPEALLDLMRLGTEAPQKCVFLASLLLEYAKTRKAEGRTADEMGSMLQAHYLLRAPLGLLPPEQEVDCRLKLEFIARRLADVGDNSYIQERLSAPISLTKQREL